jgi:hypothetical protein
MVVAYGKEKKYVYSPWFLSAGSIHGKIHARSRQTLVRYLVYSDDDDNSVAVLGADFSACLNIKPSSNL